MEVIEWGEIERASGAKRYGWIVRVGSAPIADLEALWARYLKLADPGSAPPLPGEEDWTPPADRSRSARRWSLLALVLDALATEHAARLQVFAKPVSEAEQWLTFLQLLRHPMGSTRAFALVQLKAGPKRATEIA